MKYSYVVLSVSREGFANIEYKHEQLGTTIKTILLPYDKPIETVRRIIVEQFPSEVFYSRHLVKSGIDPSVVLTEGEIDISFDDRFYDVQIETSNTVDV